MKLYSLVGAIGAAVVMTSSSLASQTIADLASHEGEVPTRLVGYGLVVGLDGTGDRSFGSHSGAVMTVQSVVNLLRRFNIEIPPERLRVRNVAAVLVTAEVSPWLRPGGRFEVQIASLGDATSLRGGVLWMTPLQSNPDEPPTATAQGPVLISSELGEASSFRSNRRGNSARIPEGGSLETPLPAVAPSGLGLILKRPDLISADRIARAIEAAHGDGSATVVDPGLVRLNPPGDQAATPLRFLAAIDTIPVVIDGQSSVIIDTRSGSVVTGGLTKLGPATVNVGSLTLRIGNSSGNPDAQSGTVDFVSGATVLDVLAGLHAAGASGGEVVTVLEALAAAGSLRARLIVR